MPRVPLSTIAHGRSGDKGNHSNVAVIAYTDAGYEWLKANLTAVVVAKYFAGVKPSRVERFEAPNLRGLNFMLYDSLGGGASRSLRSDTQGKAFAMALLQMEVELPANFASMQRPASGPWPSTPRSWSRRGRRCSSRINWRARWC